MQQRPASAASTALVASLVRSLAPGVPPEPLRAQPARVPNIAALLLVREGAAAPLDPPALSAGDVEAEPLLHAGEVRPLPPSDWE